MCSRFMAVQLAKGVLDGLIGNAHKQAGGDHVRSRSGVSSVAITATPKVDIGNPVPVLGWSD